MYKGRTQVKVMNNRRSLIAMPTPILEAHGFANGTWCDIDITAGEIKMVPCPVAKPDVRDYMKKISKRTDQTVDWDLKKPKSLMSDTDRPVRWI